MGLATSYTEAYLVDICAGQPGEIHDSALNTIGVIAHDQFGNEYIYLKGVVNTVEGFAVTYDEAGVTTALGASAKGSVAWATAAIVANKFGWYARFSPGSGLLARVVTGTADNAFLGRETTDGEIGDGKAAGDAIYGCMSRAANASGATVLQLISTMCYPFVDDIYGA